MLVNYIILFIILISLGILHQKYIEKQSRKPALDDYANIRKYLLKDKTLDKCKKPILWIHIPYEYNSRNWLDFGSRSTHELNQPYMNLTVKSIIKNCDQSFKIVLVDDGTFQKLIPDWNIRMELLAEPMKGYIRQLALAKLLYIYGGIHVPISFLCFRDLIGLYNRGTNDDTMFVCETCHSQSDKIFYPSAGFMGAKKENPTMRKCIEFMERAISDDYTAEITFVGGVSQWCSREIAKGTIRLIPGTDVGTRTVDDTPVSVEILLGDDYVHFYGKMYGIWIPDKMILKRSRYEWFARMSPEQIVESQFILAKYFVLALAPDSHMGVIEPPENAPDWIDFWRVPLTNKTLNVFGHKPLGLGNNVSRAPTAGDIPA